MQLGSRAGVMLVLALVVAACGPAATTPSNQPASAPASQPPPKTPAPAPQAAPKSETKPEVAPATKTSGAPITWRLPFPSAVTDAPAVALKKWADSAMEKTNGRLKIEFFPNEQLGEQAATVRGVMEGTLELSATGGPSGGTFDRRWEVLNQLMLFDGPEHAYKVLDGPLGDELGKTLEPKGVKVLGYFDWGFRNFGNARRPVNSVDDLKGLKFRIHASPALVAQYEALGAVPVGIPWSEAYTAIRQGTIDGVDVAAGVYLNNKMHEVAKNYVLSGHNFASGVIWVGTKQLEALPPDVRDFVIKGAREAALEARKLVVDGEAKSLEELKAKGVKVTGPLDKKSMRERVDSVRAQARDLAGTEYYDKFMKGLDAAR
ncbi:MAG: TRAP transporter substrate-binding protein [Chloroflexi bacterium]|nr:TRAP transporter substrate-binding protein [Chloroflexota bacterium]